MNGFSLARSLFLGAASLLASLAVLGLYFGREHVLWRRGHLLAVYAVLATSVVLIWLLAVSALTALVSHYPYAQVAVFSVLRGRYAWTYWVAFSGLVAAQSLWSERLHTDPRRALALAAVCIFSVLVDPLALRLWGSP